MKTSQETDVSMIALLHAKLLLKQWTFIHTQLWYQEFELLSKFSQQIYNLLLQDDQGLYGSANTYIN